MNMSIEKMLSHVYEIEGLMLVSRRLGEENTPDVITNKMHRKVRELAEMCGMEIAVEQETPVQQPEAAPVEQPVEQPAATELPAQQEPVVPAEAEGLPEEDYDADETWQHDNGEEFNEVFELNYEEPKHETVADNEVPVADREPDEDITVEFIEADEEPAEEPAAEEPRQEQPTPVPPIFNPRPEAEKVVAPVAPAPEPVNDEPVPEPDPDVLPEADEEPDITVEFIEADDVPVPEPEDLPIPPTPTEIPVEVEPESPIRVDEKLQRHLSKDIRKALSINDRFRFQRELFAGSADALNTAIEHIEAMRSYGNAELYFYSQLNWDRENEVVKDFMTLVRNHFQ